MALTPTHRYTVQSSDPDRANQEIWNILQDLAFAGERPWCEVRYPAPEHLDEAARDEWLAAQEDTFDVVELDPVAGTLTTVPPYAELEGNR